MRNILQTSFWKQNKWSQWFENQIEFLHLKNPKFQTTITRNILNMIMNIVHQIGALNMLYQFSESHKIQQQILHEIIAWNFECIEKNKANNEGR